MGLQIPRRPGLLTHPDPALLLRRQHVHQHCRSHLRNPFILAGLQFDPGLYRQQSTADAGAAGRDFRRLPRHPQNCRRRHLRTRHCRCREEVPVRIRAPRDRNRRLSHMVQNLGNLCRGVQDCRADLASESS